MSKIEVTLVRSNGEINIDETVRGLIINLHNMKAEENVAISMIEEHVNAVLESKPGISKIALDAFATFVMNSIQSTNSIEDSQFSPLKEKVLNYLRSQKEIFHISRGKGIMILSRLSDSELEMVNNQREKENAKNYSKISNTG